MTYLPPRRGSFNSVEADASRVIPFPFARTLGLLPNDPKMEFLFACLDGHPNASKKRLILLARSPEVAFLDDSTAQILRSALGLEAA